MPLELPEDGLDGGRRRDDASKVGDAQGNTYNGGDEDADEQRAGDALDQQRGCEHNTEDAQQNGGIVQIAQSDEGGLGRGDDTSTLQADKGNKQADTGTDGATQDQWDGIDDVLPQSGDGEQDEDDTLDEHGGQGKLPAIAHGEHHGVGKEGIQAHARSQRKGQLGIERHDQRGYDSRDAGGGKHGTGIHARGR